MENKEEIKILDPNNSEIKVSNKRDQRFYEFLSKLIIKKFGFVELISLGNTSEKSIKICDHLIKNNYAIIEKINSDEIQIEDEDRTRKCYKFYIKLKKTDKFDSMIEGKFR